MSKRKVLKMVKKQEFQCDLEFFTVYDSKAAHYREPVPAPNTAVILRDFETSFKKDEASKVNSYYINSEDYKLFRIGMFNMETGELRAFPPEHIVNMHDIRAAVDLKKGPGALSST